MSFIPTIKKRANSSKMMDPLKDKMKNFVNQTRKGETLNLQ